MNCEVENDAIHDLILAIFYHMALSLICPKARTAHRLLFYLGQCRAFWCVHFFRARLPSLAVFDLFDNSSRFFW